MSSLVTTGPKSRTRPYAIYRGPRTGDEFLEWNSMGQIIWTEPPAELDVLYGLGQLWDMGQLDKLFGAATNMFGESVESIEFRSQVTPPIVINQPFAPAAQRPPAKLEGGTPITRVILDKAAKPAMYIRLKGGVVLPIEPYGAPTENHIPMLIGGAVALLAVGTLVGAKLGQMLLCRRTA